MKYSKAFDIWSTSVDLLSMAQPGQWVYAGDKTVKGRFIGVKKNGIVVVAWSRRDIATIKKLRQFL